LYQPSKDDRKTDLKNLQEYIFDLIQEFYRLDLFKEMDSGEYQKMLLNIYGSGYFDSRLAEIGAVFSQKSSPSNSIGDFENSDYKTDYSIQATENTQTASKLDSKSQIVKYLNAEQVQKLIEIITATSLKYPNLDHKLNFKQIFELSIFELIMVLPENSKKKLDIAFDEVVLEIVQNNLIKGVRLDGRDMHTTRKISCDTNILPQTHGSSLFERGETQVLNVLTLGTLSDAQILDDMENIEEHTKRYMHHYNFPPYSVGETGRFGSPGRREIGHGALAEKALLPVIPDEEEFPYTIRLVSEVLGSNGSSSMASTCASSLSLMQAGVPIKKAIGGVAMGLVIDKSDKMKQKQLKRDVQVLKEILVTCL
jgi:polyribonucleotide nucleotidyltransferase